MSSLILSSDGAAMLSLFNPVTNLRAFFELLRLHRRYYSLILEMARRDIVQQYAAQVFGVVWAVAHPVFMMLLFVFIFGFVFKQRVGGTLEMPLDYTAYILSGLVPWLAFQQCMSKACSALVMHSNLVKQVVFPIEVLPIKSVVASMVPQVVGTIVFVGYVLWSHGSLLATYWLLPLLIAVQFMAMLGVTFLFAALGVFLRDLKDFVALFAQIGLYLMPVVYLPSWVPPVFEPVLHLNPFSYMAWCYQDALYYGRMEHAFAWPVFFAGSLAIFVIGYRFFRRMKPHYGDLL